MTYPGGWQRAHRHHHLKRRRDERCRDPVDAVLTAGQSDGGRDDKKHEATGDFWNVEGAMGLRHREDMPADLCRGFFHDTTAQASRLMTLQRRQQEEPTSSTTSDQPPATDSDQLPENTEVPSDTTSEDPPPTSTSEDPPPSSTSDDPPPPTPSDDPPPPSTSDDPPPPSTSDDPPPPPSTTEEPPPPPSTTDEPPPSSSSEPPPPPSSSSESPPLPSSSSEPPPSSSSEPPPSSSSEPPPSSSSEPPSSSSSSSSSSQPPSSSSPPPPSSSSSPSSSSPPLPSSDPTSSSSQPPSSSEPSTSSTADETSSSSSSTAPDTTSPPPGSTSFVIGDDTTTYESATRTVDPSSTPGTLGTNAPDRDDFASNTGAIVGVAIGSAAAVLLLALLVFYLMRWHRQNRDNHRLEQTALGAAALGAAGAGGGRGSGNRRSVALLEDDEMLQLRDSGSGRTNFGASSEGHSTSGLLVAGAVIVGSSSRSQDRKRHSDSYVQTATYQPMTLHQSGVASDAYLPDINTPSLEDGTAYPEGTGYAGAKRSRSLMVANNVDDASPVDNPPANYGLLSRGPSTIQFADPPPRPPPVPLPNVQHPEQRPKSPDSPVSNEGFSMISHSSYSQASHSNQALHRSANAALLSVGGHIGGFSNSGSGSGSGSAPNSNQNSHGSSGVGSSGSATLLDPASGQDSSSSGHGHVQPAQGKYPPTSYFSIGKGKGRAQYPQQQTVSGPSSDEGGHNNSSSSHLSHSNEHESSQSHSGHGAVGQQSASIPRQRSKSGTLRSTPSVKGLGGLINRLRAAAGSPAHSDDEEYDDFGSGRRGTYGLGSRRRSGSEHGRGPIPILETTSPVGRVKRVSAPSTPVLSPKPYMPVGAIQNVEHGGSWSSGERVAQLRTPPPGTLGALPKWTWTEDGGAHRPPWTPHELPPTPHSGDSADSYYAEGLLDMGASGSSHHGHGVVRRGSLGHAPLQSIGSSKATGPRLSDEGAGALGVLHEENPSNRSQASLVDHVDYSRPFGGFVFNRMHSTATFATTATDNTENTSAPPSIVGTPPAIAEGPERELRLQS